jgi:hypothetical protein
MAAESCGTRSRRCRSYEIVSRVGRDGLLFPNFEILCVAKFPVVIVIYIF